MIQSLVISLYLLCCLYDGVLPLSGSPIKSSGPLFCDTAYDRPGRSMLQCRLTKDEFLDYKEIRMWTEKEKDKYSAKISCNGGGSVHLPWPFVAKNVLSLEIYGCLIHGFLSEMIVKPSVPHELKTLILSSVSIDLPINNMVSLHNNIDKVPLETDCGPTTLETLVLRDIHYDLKITPEGRDKLNKIQLGRKSTRKHATIKQCVYPYLRYIDESGSRRNGKYHLKLVPEYSQFPVLEVYNMSGNNLNHIPTGFQRLHSKKFPVLRYVDFSNNALSRFEFEFDRNIATCNLKMLDLRRNQISSLPKTSVEQLLRLKTVLVDLRYNPLRCDCSNIPFRQLIREQFKSSKDIREKKLLSDVTCSKPDFKTGQTKDLNLLNFSIQKECVT